MNKYLFYIILLLPTYAAANELCPTAKSTSEIADCLIEKVQKADSNLKHYLDVAKKRYGDDPKLVKLLDTSQAEWEKYKNAHCDAVYQEWSEGTVRLIYHPYCLLYMTRSRTYDIWREFLTYQDSTEPLLPEPELILYKKW